MIHTRQKSTPKPRRPLWSSAALLWRRVLTVTIATLLALVLAPVGTAAAVDTSEGGPGGWHDSIPGGPKKGSQAWLYEQQLKGPNRMGQDYWVPYPETREKPGFDLKTWVPKKLSDGTWDGVSFDSWDKEKQKPIEAKGGRYAYLLDEKNKKWSKTEAGLEKQAKRQERALKGTGVKAEWKFAETASEKHMRSILEKRGIGSNYTPPKNPNMMSAPGSPADPKGLVKQTGPAPGLKPGGIDFSTLEMRYLSETETDAGTGVNYSFKNAVGEDGDGMENAQLASDAFFVWLELDPSKFWVNLHPEQPDRIIDPELARTDVGKVLLEADVELKRSITEAMDPQTETGQEFWQRIYNGPDDDTCFWVRSWISPGTASVRTSGGELNILDAPLKVQAKTGEDEVGECPGQTDERKKYNQKAIDELLVPQMEEEVNADAEYADLRRVFLSRVAAQWYRELSAEQETHFGGLIDQGILGPWESREPWDPKDVYNEYLDLLNSETGSIVVDGVTYTFTFGGVDFSKSPSKPKSEQDFKKEHPKLPKTVKSSLKEVTTDGDDSKSIWAGGTSTVSGKSSSGDDSLPVTGASLWQAALVALAVVIIGAVVVTTTRRRRRQAVWGAK